MPKPCPKEFRDDVVRIAENREPGVSVDRIAVETGAPSPDDRDAKVCELLQRNRLLEQEVEVLRRATAYLSQAHLPR